MTPKQTIVGFNLAVEGCDTNHWLPNLTAAELGLDRPKLTIDFATSETFISFPNEVESESVPLRCAATEAA